MKRNWKTLKRIISEYGQHEDIFLSMIDDDGIIASANSNMVRFLHMKDHEPEKINLFDLLHPVCHDHFKTAIYQSGNSATPYSLELFVKNGYYHPMKWQVCYLPDQSEDDKNLYLCIGHKIIADERQKQFNQLGEENYQVIMEGLSDGFFLQDKKGELIAANHKAAAILDVTLERLYQLSDIENLWDTSWTIKDEDGDAVFFAKTPFMKALQTGQTFNETLIITLRNGEDRWLKFHSQPLFENSGNEVFAVASSITDITVEKKLTGQLLEKDAFFRAFMKRMPNLSWVVDEEANLVYANESFYEYFKLDEATSLNKNIVELVPGAVAEALYQKHIEVLKTGKAAELVEKVKWVDGTQFMFNVNIFPIDDIPGRRMLGGHAINIADKYETEKRLQEVSDRLLLLTRATSDAIWEWDMQTGSIFRNDALMDMLGYHHDSPKGLSWWLRRIHPEDRNRISDKIKESTDNSLHSWEDEYRFKCEDGQYKHMRDKGYIVYENGLPVKMIGSLQDVSKITEMKDLLVQEKLQRQKEISETVIRVQEKERTRIGHELHDNVNQILSTTKLFVDMLTPDSKEQRDIKDKSIEYIMLAIEEIRKLSRELVVPQLKGNGLVDSIRTLIDDLQMSNVIKIKFTHDSEIDLLSPGKKVTFFRIVQEQLKNILKYSKAVHAEIYLECKDNTAKLIVKDDGIGFDPKKASEGIGLSNIHERARFYNGNVNIETSSGNGCILTVTIPALD